MIVGNIQELCKLKGISISDVEKSVGLSSKSIYRWDEHSPSVSKVVKVARFFDVSVESLVGDEQNDNLNIQAV